MTIGQKILSARKRKSLSQETLSEISGISLRTVQRIEGDEVMPRPFTLQKLAEILEVDLKELTSNIASSNGPKDFAYINLYALVGLLIPLANLFVPVLLLRYHKTNIEAQKVAKMVLTFQLWWTAVTFLALISTILIQKAMVGQVAVGHVPPAAAFVYVAMLFINVVGTGVIHKKLSKPGKTA